MDIKYINRDFDNDEAYGVGLGNFDGLHLGHMALISELLVQCRARKVKSSVYTFIEHPNNVLKKNTTLQIMTIEKKLELLGDKGIDCVFLENFNSEYAQMKPETFVKEILVDKLHISFAVVGFNYTFGYKGSGNVEALKELGHKYNFDVIVIPPIIIGDNIVSSTLVRKYVKLGVIDKIKICTGRDYSIYGIVELGRQRGRTLGFPTANIIPQSHLVLPKQGVYITRTLLDGALYNSITNIGRNPTFEEKRITVETHIFGRNGNMYGKRIEVFFLHMLRGEKKFADSEELCRQINKDITAAEKFFEYQL